MASTGKPEPTHLDSAKKLALSPVEQRAAGNLKRLRNEKRFSVRKLADATAELAGADKIGPNAISQIENSGRRMSLADAWTLARALGVSPLDFFLPLDEDDGAELGTPGDGYGPRALPRRVVRALYRLPHESAPDYVTDEARAAMAREIAPYTDVDKRVAGQLDQIAVLLNKIDGAEQAIKGLEGVVENLIAELDSGQSGPDGDD